MALALAAMGEDADAVAGLAGALTLACPQGYVRVFADEGPPMAALLARLIAAQRAGHVAEIPLACLAGLQQPWRLLAARLHDVRVRSPALGGFYIASGRT